MVDTKFLRLNINDDYNNGMGDVDIADQLRFCYRFDHWMRKYKWWHSLFWWGFGVQMVNAYVVYKTYHKQIGCKPLSHYEFQNKLGTLGSRDWNPPTLLMILFLKAAGQ